MLTREDSENIVYGRLDPQGKPRYTLAQAARYLHLSPTTLRSWVRGRSYPKREGSGHFKPLIKAADLLSFSNLVEAHVLRALRVEHHVQIAAVRTALAHAQRRFHIKRLLLSRELLASPGNIFIDRYGELINLSRGGQLAMKQVLEAHLKWVEWDLAGLPVRLFPPTADEVLERSPLPELHRVVVIDPRISFGKPIVASRAIRTSAIFGRIDAGETLEDVAADYGLKRSEVEAALLYEQAAA